MNLDMSSLESVTWPFEVPNTTDEEAIVKPHEDTTILAFIFKGGVMVAADSRDSMLSPSVKKIIKINPHMLLTMAGRAVDCQFWYRDFCIKSRLYELENDRRISVTRASELLREIIFSYQELLVTTMIAGWDETGPELFFVADISHEPLKMMRFSAGFGSRYANGVLDNGYYYGMSIEEATELAKRAIGGGASGGVASVYHIGPQGWKKLSGDNIVIEPHHRYYSVMPKAVDHKEAMQTGSVAFIFKGGLIVAADSRATMGGYNSSLSMKKIKIIEITPYMLAVAGGPADPKHWGRNLRMTCWYYEEENNRRYSVHWASNFLATLGLSVGTMIAGWDETGPDLYYADEWKVEDEMWFCVGSGSMDANDVLSKGHHYDMSIEEAAELAKRAIGGFASVYHIGPQGWKKLSGDDVVVKLRQKHAPPKTVEQHIAEVAGLKGFVGSTKNYTGFIWT